MLKYDGSPCINTRRITAGDGKLLSNIGCLEYLKSHLVLFEKPCHLAITLHAQLLGAGVSEAQGPTWDRSSRLSLSLPLLLSFSSSSNCKQKNPTVLFLQSQPRRFSVNNALCKSQSQLGISFRILPRLTDRI